MENVGKLVCWNDHHFVVGLRINRILYVFNLYRKVLQVGMLGKPLQ